MSTNINEIVNVRYWIQLDLYMYNLNFKGPINLINLHVSVARIDAGAGSEK